MQKALSLFEKGPLALVAGRDLTVDLWVMSHTTNVSPVSDVLARLADQAKASKGVVGVSRRLPRPEQSR
jgi:hypothetical protein